jgi:hypothetical protein
MQKLRVTIYFTGKPKGALGVVYPITERRTIEVPDQFTMLEAKEAARMALYYPDEFGVHPNQVYDRVSVEELAFN